MLDSSSNTPPPGGAKLSGSIYWGLALVLTLTIGIALGFLGHPFMTKNEPVLIVVTATPGAEDKALGVANPSSATNPTIMDLVLNDARHFQGNDNAPVTVVEFSDFKCGYCRLFATQTLERLRSEYINTGKVRFIYKHFAILSPESNLAAEASECATEQNGFWPYHDAIFTDQAAAHSTLDAEQLVTLATKSGLETTSFKSCLTSGRYSNQIKQESLSVQSLGVRGTPAFLVNGTFISGAQPFEFFQQMIETQLQKGAKK